jgi:hypothetical protein
VPGERREEFDDAEGDLSGPRSTEAKRSFDGGCQDGRRLAERLLV